MAEALTGHGGPRPFVTDTDREACVVGAPARSHVALSRPRSLEESRGGMVGAEIGAINKKGPCVDPHPSDRPSMIKR